MRAARSQRGSALLLVLLALTALALGALSLARTAQSTTLIAGNLSFKDAALQASELGVAEAYSDLQALAGREANVGGWYFATQQNVDAAGVPTVDWASAKQLEVDAHVVRYVVERMCTGPLPVATLAKQCTVKQVSAMNSTRAGEEAFDAPAAPVYRITVVVSGPRGTRAHVQALSVH